MGGSPVITDRTRAVPAALVPQIHRLTVERFRGIERLVWYPEPGVNFILGGGDVGKTTVLDAIALLFSPTNYAVLSDADFFRRDVENGFCIETVMGLPEHSGINQQAKHAWPWEWDGTDPKLPNIDCDPATNDVLNPVYCLRVRGTSDLDLSWEILQPDNSTEHLSVSVRRKIGLVRLGGDDRNDRDLRLIQGSALDRLLSDKTLRARLGQKLDKSDIEAELNNEAKLGLQALDTAFKDQELPTGLSLGLTGSQGLSVNALVGLTAMKDSVKLPLSNWGAGTRRLAALEIAAVHQGDSPITLVDEVERGLEPYRQRMLISELEKRESQAFVTTHSAAALSAASNATIWYMDFKGSIGKLKGSVMTHRRRDPEAFLARLTIIAEGITEVGFAGFFIEKALCGNPLDFGLWVTDAEGNDNALKLLEDLTGSGLLFAGFVDDESRAPSRWADVKSTLGALLFRWPSGCLEENIIRLVPDERLEEFIKDPDGESGHRLRTLAERLGITDKDFHIIRSRAPGLTQLIIDAACGAIPPDRENADKADKKALKKHAQDWFKSVEGGRELANKIIEFDLWPQLAGQLLPFLNAVRTAVHLPEIATLPS